MVSIIGFLLHAQGLLLFQQKFVLVRSLVSSAFFFTSAYAQFGMAFLGTVVYDYEGAGLSRHANFETAFRLCWYACQRRTRGRLSLRRSAQPTRC